jgi:hypothetical protein
MGNMLLIVLLGVIIIFGVTNIMINANINDMSDKSVNTYAQTRARNIGNSTVWIQKNKLWKNSVYRTTTAQTLQIDGGTATFRLIDTNYSGVSLVKMDITANYLDATQKIDVFLKMEYNIPSFLRRGILAQEEIIFNGDYLSVKDTNNPTLNTDVHSNKSVTMNGSNILVEGFVTSAGDIYTGGKNIKVLPNLNPLNLPGMQKNVAPVSIPDMVPSSYLSKATTVLNGDQTFGGTILLGTSASPKIIYVKGKAFFNSTTISGYGVIISEGDVEINGNIRMNTPDPDYSNFGIFSGSKVMLKPSITVEATIYSQNESVVNTEKTTIIGSFISKNKITFNGLYQTVYYKPPSENLISPFFTIEKRRPKIVHWYE